MSRLILLLATVLGITTLFGQSRGEIHGTVLDQNGQPVVHAKVGYDNLDDHRILHGLLRQVETDVNGNFVFDNLDWGRYAIYPRKEEDGYPNLRFAIYSGGTYQIATVSADHPIASITARLGPKAAVLHGTISRSTDGAPIGGRIELNSPGHPQWFMATSVPSDYRVLIPSDTDVEVSFSESGYKVYSLRVLHMKSGDDSSMDVKLTPEAPID